VELWKKSSVGDVMAHVVVRVGDNFTESAITRRSADDLKLKTVAVGSFHEKS
jgi:molybdopterin-binding protein